MSSFFDRDLSALDWHELSPEERAAVANEAVRLAKALRAEFLRQMARRLRSRWRVRRKSTRSKGLRAPRTGTVPSTLFRGCM